MDYGREFDFHRSAMEQFRSLIRDVPEMSVLQKMNENCEYTTSIGDSKNCYLLSDSDFCEDSMYSAIVKKSKNVVDGLNIYMCENVYNSINCTDWFGLINCFECDSCQFLLGYSRLTSCSYCYESSNLVNKKYIIRNKQVTENEWKEFIKLAPIPPLRDFWIARNRYIIDSENVIGNNIYKSKNIVTSYNIWECENVRYSALLGWSKDCYDVDAFWLQLSRWYDSISVGSDSDQICFGDIITSNCSWIFYSHCLMVCKDNHHCMLGEWDDWMLSEIVNSPRMGECGYWGYDFDDPTVAKYFPKEIIES